MTTSPSLVDGPNIQEYIVQNLWETYYGKYYSLSKQTLH
jgi:hypothetical protein